MHEIGEVSFDSSSTLGVIFSWTCDLVLLVEHKIGEIHKKNRYVS